jgi:hypothetical protein
VRAANADKRIGDSRFRAFRRKRASSRAAPTLLAVAALIPGACAAEGWFFTIGGGGRNIHVDRTAAIANGFSVDGNFVTEIGGGYVFSNNIVLEAATTDAVSITGVFGFASYEFEDDRVMVGYAFPASEKFRIIPSVGASFWDFRATEVVFFGTPTPERTLSGTDLLLRIGGEFLVGETFGISFGYTRVEFDVGDTSVASVAMRVQF